MRLCYRLLFASMVASLSGEPSTLCLSLSFFFFRFVF